MKRRYFIGLLALLLATAGLLLLAERSANDFSREIQKVSFSVHKFGPSTPDGLTLWTDDLRTDDRATIRKILQVHEVTVQQLQQKLFGDEASQMTIKDVVYTRDLRAANYAELRADDSLELSIHYTMKNGDTPYFRALFTYSDQLAAQKDTPAHAVKAFFDDPDVLMQLRLPEDDRLVTDWFSLVYAGKKKDCADPDPDHVRLIRDALEQDIRAGRAGGWRPPWEKKNVLFRIDLNGLTTKDLQASALITDPEQARQPSVRQYTMSVFQDEPHTAAEQVLIDLGYYHKPTD